MSRQVVAVFSDRIVAELARGFLEAQGILAVVRADDTGGLGPDLSLVRGVRLLVASDDLDTARDLLTEQESGER